jgi:hypothetical protein
MSAEMNCPSISSRGGESRKSRCTLSFINFRGWRPVAHPRLRAHPSPETVCRRRPARRGRETLRQCRRRLADTQSTQWSPWGFRAHSGRGSSGQGGLAHVRSILDQQNPTRTYQSHASLALIGGPRVDDRGVISGIIHRHPQWPEMARYAPRSTARTRRFTTVSCAGAG